jgi:hypothetical protein
MTSKLKLLCGFLAILFVWLVAAGVSTATADPRLSRCGVGAAGGNAVGAAFEIPAANRIWEYLPALGISPELAENREPAYVVVFSGDFRVAVAGTPDHPGGIRTVNNALCVIRQNEQPIWYSDVSRAGFRAP